MNLRSQKDLGSIVKQFRPDLAPFENIYRDVHHHAELSCKESRTAAVVSAYIEDIGFTTYRGIGGYGVVGVLDNGPGHVIMLRSELDALPIKEMTDLPYASTAHMQDQYGFDRPVMHACGHDMHLSCLLAASKLLQSAKSCWSGTLIVLFQPNEEHTEGAQAMVDGGLYERIPIPDIVLGQHSVPLKAGTVNIRPGPILVAADTIRICVSGALEDSLNPQNSINPINIACKIVLNLESIVNEEPGSPSFTAIKCEEIHSGQRGLDVVEDAELVLDVKTYDPKVRDKVHQQIKRIVQEECEKAGARKPPSFDITVRAPLTCNSPEVVKPLKETFKAYFKENAGSGEPRRPCEDFSILATSQGRPYAFWFFGTVEAAKWDDACRKGRVSELIAGNHSPYYAPTIQPTLRTGTDAMALGALTFLT